MNLAFRMRPQNLDEFFGQENLVGKDKIIRKMINSQSIFSMIFWGPPGSGKTTLANIIAHQTDSDFYALSAVSTGKDALMKIVSVAKENQKIDRRTILFLDEIHRWNKAQQDSLLPYVENGLLILIGATTENPSFEIISALLSRCRVFVLKSLEKEDLEKIINIALKDKDRGVGSFKKSITPDARELIIRLSGGDARIMLNALEVAVTTYPSHPELDSGSDSGQARMTGKMPKRVRHDMSSIITLEIVKEVFQTKSAGLYDKKADEHYSIISAFIKSMRGSDTDAALYYLARMLENGEDPKFIARRMIIFSSEDIGMADRGSLIQANEAFEAVQKIGMPEAQLILAHIVIYLSLAKKSRAVPNALEKTKEAVYELPNEPVPLHLRNAPTKLMKELGYAKDYKWSKNYVGPTNPPAHSGSEPSGSKTGGISFLPEKLKNKKFYEP
ncbi:MAG: replication-associated recombination protein A [Candidatus Levybacteria bacterium]|nr:replication-associated recombination protein A [Candidatus Levybacteria bacterium]